MEGAFETVEDCYGVGRAAGDVVARVVGVDDGETIVVLVREASDLGLGQSARKGTSECGTTYLSNVPNWSGQGDGVGVVAEFAPVKVEELEKHLAEMMFGNKVSTLYLWHKLQHADNQANHCETTNSSIYRFIQTTHE